MNNGNPFRSKYKKLCRILGVVVLVVGLLFDLVLAYYIIGPYLRFGFDIGFDNVFQILLVAFLILITFAISLILFALAENIDFLERISRRLLFIDQIRDENSN